MSTKSSSSKKIKNPESSNSPTFSPLRSGMSVHQPIFTSQNRYSVLWDLNEGESFDSGRPKPLRSSPIDKGRPKTLQSSSKNNEKPKSLRSSSNNNGRPKSLHSSSNDNQPKSLRSSCNDTGRPQTRHSSSNANGSPKSLRSSPTSVKSPKRSPNEGFRNWTISDQTRQWPKNNEMREKTAYRNPAKTHHQSPMLKSGSVEQKAFTKLMSEVNGCFTHLCEKCYDSTPPIMCLKSAIGPHCSAQHPWEPNQVLVNILDMEGEQVRYLKIRQLPRNSSLKLCPDMDKQFGCIQGNSCRRAHNKVELKLWKYQVEHKIGSDRIARLCCTTSGHLSTVSKLLQNLRYADTADNQSTSKQMISYFESKESWFYVRPRPLWLPLEVTPVLCKYGDECRRAGSCTHPHCLEEVELWNYMAKNQFRTLDEVLSASKSPAFSTSSPQPLVSKGVFQVLPYYCQYCHKQFPNLENLHQHLQTLEHRSSVDSDMEKAGDWKYRDLPLNVVNGGIIKLCKVETCVLGESSCTDAHSPKELAEWKKRCEYRMMKRRTAKEQGLYPLTENDLLEMQTAGQHVMNTSLPKGVNIECSENLTKFLEVTEESEESCTFMFNITAPKKIPLRKVCLLRDNHRAYFYLPNPKDPEVKLQECPGNLLVAQDEDPASTRYCASIEFESRSMGSFNQLVMFDFGSMAMVVREIVVDVGFKALQTSKKQDERHPVSALQPNCKVVKFTDKLKTKEPFTEKLLEKYKAPALLSGDHGRLEPLSRDNYKRVMHRALYLEEIECNKKISRFATSSTLKVSRQAVLQDVRTEFAQDGHLFASVSLQQALIDDTVASQIVIRNSQSVLIEFINFNKLVHYEAAILPNQTLGDKEDEVLLIKLSKECITDLRLEDGMELNVKIKFKLNRVQFCVKHSAIDELQNMDMVLPQGDGPQMLPSCRSSAEANVNAHQQEVIAFISKHGGSDAPPMPGVGPVLMYGTFGTGKTSTIATAVTKTLTQRPSSRILICTHSNSAADLYLRDKGTFSMIRMYATMRKPESIHPTVLKYVPKDENGNIRLPDRAEIEAVQVVVTTLTMAMHLVSAGLRGNFSHILIDEAGQVLEAEVLIPLALATKDTCVVLTGDHIQMSPKVYSKQVRDAGLDGSLLQRLLLMKTCKQKFLTSNYRTCQPILDFTSKAFYKQTLKAGINHLEHPNFRPMTFSVVKGVEHHLGMSYTNSHENLEVVRQLQLMMNEWPAEWGDFQENVAVVAAYTMQVRQIRKNLRKNKLNRVTVDTVDNVQGKQFRAVIISTVRTRVINSRQEDADTAEFDYRFLSDPKLVNTAFTRAQSVLCVVGDPVALCAVGRCSTVWQDFLKGCEQSKSLHPLGTTVEAIKREIQSANRKLNPKAKPFKPSKKTLNSSPCHQKQEQLPFNLDDEQEFPTLGGPMMTASDPQDDDEGPPCDEDSLCLDDCPDDEDYILREMERQIEEDNRRELMEKTTEESTAKVTLQKKPLDGDVVQLPGDVDGGHHGQGDGLESIAKVTIQQKRENEEVVQLQGDVDGGHHRQGDGLESIAKVTVQKKREDREVVQLQGDMEGGRHGQGDGLESIAKINIQSRDEEVAQQQVGDADGQQPAAGENDEPESIAKVDVQERAGETKPNHEELPEIKMMPKSSKKQNIRMQKKDNFYVLHEIGHNRSNLQGAGDFDGEDEEEEQESGLEMLSAEKRQEGLSLVSSNPEYFKRCLFYFETSGFVFAIPNGELSSKKILICGKKRRGQALNMDEVVVEILNIDETQEIENVTAESSKKKIYGKVICILKRSTNPYRTRIICTLDKHSKNLLVPSDRTFPKIVAYSCAGKKSRWSNSRKTDDIVQITIFKRNNLGSRNKRRFDKYAYVRRKDKLNKVFAVEYSHWQQGHRFPMGYVVKELSPADNKKEGMHTLKLMHGIREEFKPKVHEEIEREFPWDWTIPDSEILERNDLRSKLIFTVDNPETQDLDDALSIDKEKDGDYCVGVHIADVSYFVEKHSALDKEARERAVSFYPASSEPVNMLPSRLIDLCSLQPDKDRLAISVFFNIHQDGSTSMVDAMNCSVIRSRNRITYEDAEKMINTHQQDGSEVAKKVFQLGQLTQLVRKIRLGVDGCQVFSHGSEEEELQHPRASSMVEELMLIANEAVANLLMYEYPRLTPLRSQLSPSPEKLSEWRSKYQHDIPNSPFLKSKACSSGTGQTGAPNDVLMMKDKWQNLKAIADSYEPDNMQMADILCCDQNHPKLAVAQMEFFRLQENAMYISSGDQQENKKMRHHTLDKTYYTNFTSPIRRYIDIVVHRMLICVLEKAAQASGKTGVSSDPPYTTEEMSAICHHSTVQRVRAKRFEKDTEALMLALKLQEVPETFLAYVASIDGAYMELLFPHRSYISKTARTLLLSHLKPHMKRDTTDDEGDKTSLKWKLQIYDENVVPEEVSSLVNLPLKMLDSEQFVARIDAADRQSMHKKIRENDLPGFQQVLRKGQKKLQRRESDKRSKRQIDKQSTVPVAEVTSEMVDSKGNHATFVEASREFKSGDVLQITLSAALFKGVISPRIQQVNLTPELSFCTEHRAEPLQSFDVVASKSLVTFSDINKYQATWLPIIEMVSIHGAIHDDETFSIRNIEIKWSQVNKEDTDQLRYEGVFNMPESFCKERKIYFNSPHVKSDEKEESDEEEANDEPESYLDYLCIQYDSRKSPGELDSEAENEHQLIPASDSPGQVKAVLHAAVIDVTHYKSDLTVRLVVKKSSSPFPEVLLSSSKKFLCTVEVIPKGETDRRLEGAVRMVDKASHMIQEIALGRQPAEFCGMARQIPTLNRIIDRVTRKPFELNETQKMAVTMAAKQSFTNIQGPPGTGKTIVGARIAKLYTEMNKELQKLGMCNKRGQVLYCGPSNESVNVIANYLLNFDVKVVRVYSSMIEDQHHPIPNAAVRKYPTVQENVVPPELQRISLHSLIRQPSNTHSEEIIKFDESFKVRDYHASREEIKAYKKLISAAKEEELLKYDVILSTCSHSGSPVIVGKVNIVQCIIDEAGMCSQPETLIPLVFNNPRQIVLIGDHKQLRPIITETTAQQLGMETSLLELYQEKAIMLTTQYRMHKSICAFPSQTFYKSKLETADSVKQRRPEHQKLLDKLPGDDGYRAVFCQVVGTEKILACKAAEGNEMSRANPEEVKHAVRIATGLLSHGVKPENIIILSQYRLQCNDIRFALTSGRQDLKNIKVTTVITSQGREWDYVILSLVRSLPKVEIEEKPSLGWMHHNLGFIMDDNQMNVALTRAKKGLIIIGNRFLLQVHDKWHNLLSMYQDKSAIVPARCFLRSWDQSKPSSPSASSCTVQKPPPQEYSGTLANKQVKTKRRAYKKTGLHK